jgi:hypothetical protein
MARNRVIYQSEALYVSDTIASTGVSGNRQLDRVQSANYNFAINRQNINQYGELARIDAIVLQPPTVGLDFSYYLTDGTNERALGFYVATGAATSGNFVSGHMTTTSGKNFYIVTDSEGTDANSAVASSTTGSAGAVKSVIGIGNGFLSNYKLDVAVGALPKVSVTIEAANMLATGSYYTTGAGYSGITGQNPAINPPDGLSYSSTGVLLPSGQSNLGNSLISALRPGDVTLTFGAITGDGQGTIGDLSQTSNGIHVQSASLDIPLSRTPLQRLGSRFPFARTVDFPVVAKLSVNAILNEITAENLASVLNLSNGTDLTLTINKAGTATPAVSYVIKNARLDSESFTSSIGSNKTADFTFSTQIGGPNDIINGIFVSGIGSGSVFSAGAN